MRYSYEFKMYCVELYQQGKWPDTPEGYKNPRHFHEMVKFWVKMFNTNGPSGLLHSKTALKRTPEEKYRLVNQVLNGRTNREVALENGINEGQLYTWVRRYKELGYHGLEIPPGRPPKDPTKMKKKPHDYSEELTESEREELLRLRQENARIKAEIEVIKKEIALREEKQAALLKARNQLSSKNSGKKDMN